MSGCLDVAADSPLVAQLGLGAVALKYQHLGFSVLGLGVGSKQPHRLFRHGVKWADTDPRAVWWMWGQEKMAGIGIACGLPGGLLVVDLDRHGSADGLLMWQRFLAVNGLAHTPGPWVQTPSGGEHHWYRLPPGVTVPRRSGILPGVDIQGAHSYVAAPPSRVRVSYDDPRRPGSLLLPYTWHGCPCSLPVVPLWLLTWVMTAPTLGNGADSGGDISEDMPELADLYEHGLPVGLRNVTLHRLACQQFRRFGSADSGGQARAAIDRVLAATDVAGFGGTEVERTIASARSFVARQEAEEMKLWLEVYGRR